MSDLDLLVPSALVDPAFAPDLLRDQLLPNLARVIARGDLSDVLELSPQASPTTWQAWVFGTRPGIDIDRINLGELWAMACGTAPASIGRRYVVEPAHFKVANDHLRLEDPRGLALTLVEARALVDVIQPVLRDAGWRLDPIEPATLTHWLVTRDDDAALSAAAIERAIGDNVAAWQPRGSGGPHDGRAGDGAALAWRRCVNEIQMLWFGHPVNDAREARNLPTVNTLWMSGNGAPMTPLPGYASVDSGLPLLAALAIDPAASRSLESFDGFIGPALRDDWSGWRDQLVQLDARLGDLLRKQADGSLGVLTLVLCGREKARALVLAPRDLGKFWRGFSRKTSLVDLFGEGAAA